MPPCPPLPLSPPVAALLLPLATPPLALGEESTSPAEAVPRPRPELCVPFDPRVSETPTGLSYDQVRASLNAVIQHALKCPRPKGATELHLTYELVVGCDGLVSSIEVSDRGEAPEGYAACVGSVIEKADFPAHQVQDGFSVTYPVNVSW